MSCSRLFITMVVSALLTATGLVHRVDAGKLSLGRLKRHSLCCQYIYLEPPQAPRGAKVPVVLYLHGAGAATLGPPRVCDEMLQRLADQGYLVLAPLYIEGNVAHPYTWQTCAVRGFQAALRRVRARGLVEPDLERMAIVGESLGGLFALRFAALAGQCSSIPAPRAVILHDGAGYAFAPYYSSRIRDVRHWRYTTTPYDAFPSIADDTWLVALIAEETWQQESKQRCRISYGNANAGGVVSRAWHTSGITEDRRLAFIVHGDHSRQPPLVADHGVPTNVCDDIDRVFWTATEAALAAAFSGAPIDLSADLTATWADGSPRLTVVREIPTPQPFVWDCQGILTAAPVARWFLPKGACPSPRRLRRRG